MYTDIIMFTTYRTEQLPNYKTCLVYFYTFWQIFSSRHGLCRQVNSKAINAAFEVSHECIPAIPTLWHIHLE
jgi:hypothetical protein